MDAKLQERAEQLATEFATGASSMAELNALLQTMMKRGLETMLNAEMDYHLATEAETQVTPTTGRANCRNGRSTKKLQGDFGKIEVQTPRDRMATFEPQIVGKHQRRIEGFDDKILALYAKGLTTRDIQDVVKELYDVDVSADLVSRVTEDLENDLKTWQTRSLQSVYPIVFLDGIVVNIRGGDARVSPHCVYVALGIDLDGKKAFGTLDRQERGGEVLAELFDRPVQSRPQRHLHLLRRWSGRFRRSDPSGLSANAGAIVLGSSCAGSDPLCINDRRQGSRGGLEEHLYRPDGRGG